FTQICHIGVDTVHLCVDTSSLSQKPVLKIPLKESLEHSRRRALEWKMLLRPEGEQQSAAKGKKKEKKKEKKGRSSWL
ncbi:hypothetical protein Taro_033989, partial [Colocasia esculenta]|nr:hypothetical protein [Colocasia esculenta]